MPQYNNSVLCNCSYPGGICHVESMSLKGQDLDGIPPPSLAKLPYIRQIDFTRNYLHGTIPREWVSTKLEYISFTVNRLSGPILDYLGNISTLIYLSLEHNMFNGSVPAGLGKLLNLKNLTILANNLTGQLPVELNNLINLQEMLQGLLDFLQHQPDVHFSSYISQQCRILLKDSAMSRLRQKIKGLWLYAVQRWPSVRDEIIRISGLYKSLLLYIHIR